MPTRAKKPETMSGLKAQTKKAKSNMGVQMPLKSQTSTPMKARLRRRR